jgi:hypothetical protein
MGKCSKIVLFVLAFSIVAGIPSLRAQWVEDGVAVCTAASNQIDPQLVEDGSGGAIITWIDYRTAQDIYAQRIGVSGNVQWAVNGVVVCTGTDSQMNPRITTDGSGGAIIAWADQRNGIDWDIYAQRIDSGGNALWPADGVAICTSPDDQYHLAITSDGMGGAIIAWQDGDSECDIMAQRIDATGDTLWAGNGITVCDVQQCQSDPQIISDGASGAIVTWVDGRVLHTTDIYAQRIDAAGGTLWTPGGVAICTAGNNQTDPHLVTDGSSGAIISWPDKRAIGDWDIYAQRIDEWGSVQWTVDGVAICSASLSQDYSRLVSDNLGGAIISWQDNRAGVKDIYAQRISGGGVIYWTVDGEAICAASGNQANPEIVSDGASGAIITWIDYRTENDIYAQRINAAGSAQWTTDGIAVCTEANDQDDVRIVSDGSGGAIVTWEDVRSGSFYDIYAQRISRAGSCYPPAPQITSVEDIPDDQGGKIGIQWEKSFLDTIPHTDITHYSVWRRLPEVSSAMALEMSGEPGILDIPVDFEGPAVRMMDGEYPWEWLANVPARYLDTYALTVVSLSDSMGTDPGWQYFRIAAHTDEPSGWYDSPVDSGYSVDNLAPCAPLALEGEQSYTPIGLMLSWEHNTEMDLFCYHVYRGTDAGFTPAPGNMIASLCDSFVFDDEWTWDGGYYYKVSALDVNGNEGPFALLGPGDVTGEEMPSMPSVTSLKQNYPNPFNPMTVISFDLADPGHVSLRIYDAAGRLVRVLVDESRRAGRYEEIWDGKDGSGSACASSVYFYILSTGEFRQTRKMVLLR